jgi:hypothetical protein
MFLISNFCLVLNVVFFFFWVIPRPLNFMCQHFGALYLFHLYRQCKLTPPMKVEQEFQNVGTWNSDEGESPKKKNTTNNVTMYRIITTKKLIKHSLHLLLPLIFTSLCLPYKTPSAVSQHVLSPFSTVPFSHLGTILMEIAALFSG